MRNYYGSILLPIVLLISGLTSFSVHCMDQTEESTLISQSNKLDNTLRFVNDSNRNSSIEMYPAIPIINETDSSTLLNDALWNKEAITHYSKSSKGKPLMTLEHESAITVTAFSSQRGLILIGCEDGKVFLQNITLEQSDNDLTFLNSDGGEKTSLPNSPEKISLKTLEGHDDSITVVLFSPDETLALTASDDKTICLWETSTGTLLKKLKEHNDSIVSAMFSPDSKIVLTSSCDNTACIWDTATGQLLKVLQIHGTAVSSISWNYHDKIIMAVADNKMYIWDGSLEGNETLNLFLSESTDYSSKENCCCTSCFIQ